MFVDNLHSKITNALQQLAKLLDLIYKFTSKQREHYFQIIKNWQSQLNTLKSNLKQSNALHTQKLFNTIYMNINSLSNQIQETSLLLANKQNRDTNRPNLIKESKKTQEEAFRLLGQKEDEIKKLRQQIFEKEELIKINYQQLMDYKRQCSHLYLQLKSMKVVTNELQREISRLSEDLMRKEEQIIDFKLIDQERERNFRVHAQNLEATKNQLEQAWQKIEYFEHLTEISMNKTKLVEQNMRQLQFEAQSLNKNYHLKEHQNMKKCREIEELQLEVKNKQMRLDAEIYENKRLSQDINKLEEQLVKLQESVYNLRLQNKREKGNYGKQKEELTLKMQSLNIQKGRTSGQLKQSQEKFMDMFNQFSQLEEKYQALKANSEKRQKELVQIEQKLRNSQNKQKVAEKQLIFANKQKQVINEQLIKLKDLNKQYEIQINKLKDHIKVKEMQRTKSAATFQACNSKIKSLERDKIINERSINALTEEINDYKIRLIKVEEDKMYKKQQMNSLKNRLLRAKIEAIHQIRQELQP